MKLSRRSFLKGALGLTAAGLVVPDTLAAEAKKFWQLDRTMIPPISTGGFDHNYFQQYQYTFTDYNAAPPFRVTSLAMGYTKTTISPGFSPILWPTATVSGVDANGTHYPEIVLKPGDEFRVQGTTFRFDGTSGRLAVSNLGHSGHADAITELNVSHPWYAGRIPVDADAGHADTIWVNPGAGNTYPIVTTHAQSGDKAGIVERWGAERVGVTLRGESAAGVEREVPRPRNVGVPVIVLGDQTLDE